MDRLTPQEPHHPAPERPATEAAQDAAAVSQLCMAVDHLREAMWLLSDESQHTRAARRVLLDLKALIKTATNGRVEP